MRGAAVAGGATAASARRLRVDGRGLGEVDVVVVDHLVGPEAAHEVEVGCQSGACHPRAENAPKLHGKAADATGRADDVSDVDLFLFASPGQIEPAARIIDDAIRAGLADGWKAGLANDLPGINALSAAGYVLEAI